MSLQLEYLGFIEMNRLVQELIMELEENGGELTEDLQQIYTEIFEDVNERLFRAWNIIKESESLVESRNEEIERLQNKNKVTKRAIEQWRIFVSQIVKSLDNRNGNGSYIHSAGELNISVGKSKSVGLDEDFNAPDYVNYELSKKVTLSQKERIEAILREDLVEDDSEEVIMFKLVPNKVKIAQALKEGEVIEGARFIEKDKLTIR